MALLGTDYTDTAEVNARRAVQKAWNQRSRLSSSASRTNREDSCKKRKKLTPTPPNKECDYCKDKRTCCEGTTNRHAFGTKRRRGGQVSSHPGKACSKQKLAGNCECENRPSCCIFSDSSYRPTTCANRYRRYCCIAARVRTQSCMGQRRAYFTEEASPAIPLTPSKQMWYSR